jgi:hypothetical protein
LAHIRIYPTEPAPGAREKYTQVATVRVEGEFPAELTVYDFEFKPGFKIDFKKDDKGKNRPLRVRRVWHAGDQSEAGDEPGLEVCAVLRRRPW